MVGFDPTYLAGNSEECKVLEELFDLFQRHVFISTEFRQYDHHKSSPFSVRVKGGVNEIQIYPEKNNMPDLRIYSEAQHQGNNPIKPVSIRVATGKENIEVIIKSPNDMGNISYYVHNKPENSKD